MTVAVKAFCNFCLKHRGQRRPEYAMGLCRSCHKQTRTYIKDGLFTKEKLIASGKLVPAKPMLLKEWLAQQTTRRKVG